MAKKTTLPFEELTYEQALAELEQIVQTLEHDEHPLEEAISLFERGQNLARRCSTLLDKAVLRVQQLAGGELTELEG